MVKEKGGAELWTGEGREDIVPVPAVKLNEEMDRPACPDAWWIAESYSRDVWQECIVFFLYQMTDRVVERRSEGAKEANRQSPGRGA
mmetsp:Transcript_26312/g.51717  ORF Transcript_26312/g.51717 Transcript_26312/m.51717 type:complete len:87 (+) Transcript_26312:1195-1455(+)